MASSIKPFLDSAKERMAKSVEHFHAESRGIRTGRASSGLVDNIRVDYYGTKTPLNQLASVSVPEPRQLMVKPFDVNAVKDIEKAILASDLGLNPSIDGKALRISIPPLSEEQRMKLVSRVKSLAEEARVSMRNVRRDVLKEVETAQKDKGRSVSVTEDDVRQAKDEIQALLKSQEAAVDEYLDSKSKDIMDV